MGFLGPQFWLSDRQLEDGTTVVEIAGEIHLASAPRLQEALVRLDRDGRHALVLDLRAVELIDSTGLSVLLNALRRVTRRGGSMALVCANPTVLRLFEITGLDRTFAIRPTLEEALPLVQAAAAGSDSGMP